MSTAPIYFRNFSIKTCHSYGVFNGFLIFDYKYNTPNLLFPLILHRLEFLAMELFQSGSLLFLDDGFF